jgi:hypothetical protein
MSGINKQLVPGLIIVVGLPLAACGSRGAGSAPDSEMSSEVEAARVEQPDGSEVIRLTLSAKAAERLDIQTTVVRDEQLTPSGNGDTAHRTVVPYASVLYDAHGKTWVYSSPEPRTFVRYPISVDYIDGDSAVLLDGPPSGTAVVAVGVTELIGTEAEAGE